MEFSQSSISVQDLAGEYASNPGMFDTGGAVLIPGFMSAEFGADLSFVPAAGIQPAGEGGNMGSGGSVGSILNTVQQAVNTASQAQKLFAGVPSGNLSEFQQKAYPMMLQQARNSGLAVDCYWFGEIVRVLPDGRYGVMNAPPSLTAAEQWWSDQARYSAFYVMRCGGAGTPLLSGCHFDLMGAGRPAATGGSTAPVLSVPVAGAVSQTSILGSMGGSVVLILVLIAGAVSFFIWGRK